MQRVSSIANHAPRGKIERGSRQGVDRIEESDVASPRQDVRHYPEPAILRVGSGIQSLDDREHVLRSTLVDQVQELPPRMSA